MKGNMNLLKKGAAVGTDFVITALNVPAFRDIFWASRRRRKKQDKMRVIFPQVWWPWSCEKKNNIEARSANP